MRFLPALLIVAALTGGPTFAADTAGDCRIGAYRLANGDVVDVGASDNDALRWRRLDGTTGALHPGPGGVWTSTAGWTGRADGHRTSFGACGSGEISFDGVAGHRIDFEVTETRFAGDGVELAGRLVMPKGDGKAPVVILIHGSEDYSARDFYALQRLLPANGVGAFVYDKRGTGGSGGRYTQDFSLLANDAVAAMSEARRLAGSRAGRVGFFGTSEGGWVAPLAASRTRADFVIVGYGLAVSPLEEDREEMALEMTEEGHSASEIANALTIADAAGEVVASRFTRGFERFDALRAKYRSAPWYKDVHGNFTHFLLPLDDDQLRAAVKTFPPGVPLNYDSMPVLRALTTPQLWIQGAEDLEAPSAETRRRLDGLRASGHPITLAMFPGAEHGIYEFETRSDGERDDTRNSDGYFAMLIDYARAGRLYGPYGRATVTPAPRAAGHSRRPPKA